MFRRMELCIGKRIGNEQKNPFMNRNWSAIAIKRQSQMILFSQINCLSNWLKKNQLIIITQLQNSLLKYFNIKNITKKPSFKVQSDFTERPSVMKFYLSQNCYKWLVSLKILKAYIVSEEGVEHVVRKEGEEFVERMLEVCYDDQIYLENGYLLGVLLREILKEHELWGEKLGRVRKIAVVRQDENWAIVQEVLRFLQYPFELDEHQQQEYQVQQRLASLPSQLPSILHFLYSQYGPQSSPQSSSQKRYFHIDPQRLHPLYQKNLKNSHMDGVAPYSYPDCKNLLEYMCLLLHNAFDHKLQVEECLGLVVQGGKYLKALIRKGVPGKGFDQVENLYKEVVNSIEVFQGLLKYEPHHIVHFMEMFVAGALSDSSTVAKLTALLIESIQDPLWFTQHAFPTLIQSAHPQILSLVIQKSKPNFSEVFNETLQKHFAYEEDFLMFLLRFLPVLSKSIYCKEVLQGFSLGYLIEKAIEAFDPDSIHSSQPRIRLLGREAVCVIWREFFKKLPEIQKSKAAIAFETSPHLNLNMSLCQTLALLTNLFDMIKVFLINQDAGVQKYFKLATRFLKSKELDVRELALLNLKQLYVTMKKSFPLGCFLTVYEEIVTKSSAVPIAQSIDFELLLIISKDQSLLDDEVIKALNVAFQYFTQINGDCFVEILVNLLKFKQATPWGYELCDEIIKKWTDIKLPPLQSSIYKRKSPQQLCRFEAFGIKRREILKFQQYQKCKSLLQILCGVKDSGFLYSYGQKITKKLSQINRNKDLASYGVYLKKLQEKIKLSRRLLPQPVELNAKGLVYMSEALGRNDTIANALKELNEEDMEMQENGEDFRKLRDEVSESPIHRKRNFGTIEQGQKIKQQVTDDELNEFLLTKNDAKGVGHVENDSKKVGNIDQINQDREQAEKLYQKGQEQYLKDFTEDKSGHKGDNKGLFKHQWQLQQHQLTFLKIMKEKYHKLLDVCTQKYQSTFDDGKGLIQKFLNLLKLTKYIDLQSAQEVWLKAKQLHGDDSSLELKNLVWEVLVQLGFVMFGFKRNARVRVRMVEVFLKFLEGSFGQKNQDQGQNNERNEDSYNNTIKLSKVSDRRDVIMVRQMVFEHRLISNKLLRWNGHFQLSDIPPKRLSKQKQLSKQILKSSLQQQTLINQLLQQQQNKSSQDLRMNEQNKQSDKRNQKHHQNRLQPWLICFEVLSEVLEKNLRVGLVQPIARVEARVPTYDDNKKEAKGRKLQEERQQSEVNDAQIQLMMLQRQLQKQQQVIRMKQVQNKKTVNNNSKKLESAVVSNIQPTIAKKIQPGVLDSKPRNPPPKLSYTSQPQQKSIPTFSKLSTQQLRSKIQRRKQNLQKQIRTKAQELSEN